ncbi:Uncharacterized protein APZ42_032671 [Daphnia magna]|nr:Uncharacterized protein APZ42_032671 [Daphnia magna]
MGEVYLLVAFVFLSVAAIRMLMSLCSNLRKQKEGRRQKDHPFASEPPDLRQNIGNRAVDVFIIDMAGETPASYYGRWNEQPPPPYEDAVRLYPLNSHS